MAIVTIFDRGQDIKIAIWLNIFIPKVVEFDIQTGVENPSTNVLPSSTPVTILTGTGAGFTNFNWT